MTRRVVKGFLLVFVTVTVLTQIAKSFRTVEETTISDGKHLIFFHAKVRCPTCVAMERLVGQVLSDHFEAEQQAGLFDYRVLDYESPANAKLVEAFHIATATVLLVEQKGGEWISGRNLAELCWKSVGDEPTFQKMFQAQMDDFLRGIQKESENKPEEITLDPHLDLFEEQAEDVLKKEIK